MLMKYWRDAFIEEEEKFSESNALLMYEVDIDEKM